MPSIRPGIQRLLVSPCAVITQGCSLYHRPCRSLFSVLSTPLFPSFHAGQEGASENQSSCQGSLPGPGPYQVHVHGRSSISTRCPFASGQQAASRLESLSSGIFMMTLTSGLHGPQLPGSVAHDSWSPQTPTSFGLSRVSPSVRLISFSTWREQ